MKQTFGIRLAAAIAVYGLTMMWSGPAAVAAPAPPDSDAETPFMARVNGTGGAGLRVRQGPGTSFPTLVALPEGRRIQVVDGPENDGSGHEWYQITGFDRRGTTGWTAADYLTQVDGNDADGSVFTAAGVLTPGRTLSAKLTAYSYSGSLTRSGTPTRWGVVAVDPRVIPLGSRILIDGFEGVFIAEDTGGGVKGNHVDVFFPDYGSAIRFGVQYRNVTILE